MQAVLVGLGAVGGRAARQLLSAHGLTRLTVLARHPDRAARTAALLGQPGVVDLQRLTQANFDAALAGADAVLLAAPAPGRHWAAAAVAAGVPVVSVSDEPDEARSLLHLGPDATRAGVPVAVGAGMAPGLSCLLASWGAGHLAQAEEVHVASLGTGGPACARRHHAALREAVEERRGGVWVRRPPGSGRELVWFPGEVGGADCYRVNRPGPLLLGRAFPGLSVITTRSAASRRDRMTSWLPMLRPPHPEGTVGAVRVEVRGSVGGLAESRVLGATGRPALLAGLVAATALAWAVRGRLRSGAGGLAELVTQPGAFLAELTELGLPVYEFEGTTPAPTW